MRLGAQSLVLGAAAALIVAETLLIVWLLLRHSARRRTKLVIEERLRFEALLAELSAGLIHVTATDIDAALERGLRQVGTFLGVDRGSVDEYVEGRPSARIAWALPGVEESPGVM